MRARAVMVSFARRAAMDSEVATTDQMRSARKRASVIAVVERKRRLALRA